MVTIRDVASRAGVSPATVSRVVNGLVGYSDETKVRVEEAVAALHYEPDTFARGLKMKQSSVIGVLAPMVSDALASQVMSGVEHAAREGGYSVMLGRTGQGSTFAPGYLRTLRTYRSAGVILISAAITPEMRRVLGSNVPLISVAIRDGIRFPSIGIDDERAAYDGTKHLLALGHERIGLLAGDPQSTLVNAVRERGYRRAMAEAGRPAVLEQGNSLYDSAPPALHRLLATDPHLTAVFALSDEMGAAVVNELQRIGRRVPHDISVLGFDNTRTATHVYPALSTIAQPLERMGELAVERLLSLTDPGQKVMPHRLITRGTTAPPLSSH
ncbi:LacI family transcriptional regulator [Mycetocola manganoxydans]|uniref:LacI family transcriptional regulator n=1 Tax=Mycetocola manganoxydans TaxID=699879 RepID=A0A3L6ZXV3_9MICO|nr:LacI family DNA-binding transcriptional regulator [Mycetocola manganoxydans]RLP72331.1 LacI family transcriptional regulator [Mycetocola manganoxydans]GHD40939.1 ribose operon repressor RbsR [Mycetocola manganoxydans]